jgi:release factor glutamine methyltransferase
MTLQEWLTQAQQKIDRTDAQAIARHTLQLSRTELITKSAREISSGEDTLMRSMLVAIVNSQPMAYIIGSKEFYGLEFEVNEAVLVPRPETELLVDTALEFLKTKPNAKVLDLGTGSGCIAISIAYHAPHAQITAIDASAAALEVATRNNATHAQNRVRLLHSDWFSALGEERFDLIISNPPYIAEGDAHLSALMHEPMQALTSGADGLTAIEHIIKHAPIHLAVGGWLWLEHGYDQAVKARELLKQANFAKVASRNDLADIERISGGLVSTTQI